MYIEAMKLSHILIYKAFHITTSVLKIASVAQVLEPTLGALSSGIEAPRNSGALAP